MNDNALNKLLVACLDLTALEPGEDDEHSIDHLCQRAITPLGPVAAVCVLPRFVETARRALDRMDERAVAVATVANFPRGDQPLPDVQRSITESVDAGADEIDVVMPYRLVQAGNMARVQGFLTAVRRAADGLCLKIILETGALRREDSIQRASLAAIAAGADFIKTSTGKARTNATPEAAAVMLKAIRKTGGDCGFKAAGGIRSPEEAGVYLELAGQIMGEKWLGPTHFRIGASSLLDKLLDAGREH